jgi:hypothetical protein
MIFSVTARTFSRESNGEKWVKSVLIPLLNHFSVNNMKPDKDGLYHCVYFSTDRHHVENHYHKASSDGVHVFYFF